MAPIKETVSLRLVSLSDTLIAFVTYLLFFKLLIVGSRAFPVASAKIWNALPDSVLLTSSVDSFSHQLKISVPTIILLLVTFQYSLDCLGRYC